MFLLTSFWRISGWCFGKGCNGFLANPFRFIDRERLMSLLQATSFWPAGRHSDRLQRHRAVVASVVRTNQPWPLRQEMKALLFRVGAVAAVRIASVSLPQLPSKYLIDQNKTWNEYSFHFFRISRKVLQCDRCGTRASFQWEMSLSLSTVCLIFPCLVNSAL
jgi:hypothetical protein